MAMQRYDLVTNYRCGSSIEEMERSDDGEWIRYESVAEIVEQRDRLRAALAALVGASDVEELEQLEVAMRMMPAPAADKAVSIDAIHALMATAPRSEGVEP